MYVVLCICTGVYDCTGVICCMLCSNVCNSVNDMIFVHVLVLTMQVPMYIAFGVSTHSQDGYPIGLGITALSVCVIATEIVLRTRAYFSPMGLGIAFGLHTQYGWSSYCLLIFMIVWY